MRILLASAAVGLALGAYSLGEQPTPRGATAQKSANQKKKKPSPVQPATPRAEQPAAEQPTAPETTQTGANPVTDVAFSPDGKTLAAVVGWQGVALWDPTTGNNITNLKNFNSNYRHVAFSSGGQLLISNVNGPPAVLYDVASGKSRGLGGPLTTYSPDGKIALVVDVKMPQVNLTGKNQPTNQPTKRTATLVVKELSEPFQETSQWAKGKNPFILTVADTDSQKAFSADGKTLAVRGEDFSIMIWDLTSRKCISTFPQNQAGGWLALSPDGKILVAQVFRNRVQTDIGRLDDSESVLKLFDVAAGKEIGPLEPDQNGELPRRVIFSPDSKTVTAGNDGTNTPASRSYFVRVWDAATGKKHAPLQKSPATIRKPVVLSTDSSTLAGLCEDQKIRLWDLSSGKIVAELAIPPKPKSSCFPAFSQDGKSLAFGCGDGTIKLWTLPADRKGQVAMSFGPADFPAPAARAAPKPEVKPIPAGYTLQSDGTDVFLRDAKGNKKPLPDGDYRMPNGAIIHVRDGKKTVF